MNLSKREYLFFLEDMVESMRRIAEYTKGMDFKKFKMNYMVVDAVVRNFEIIGEASKRVPDSIKEEYPELPWKKMVGMRNLIIHGYFGIDYELIWEISRSNLPLNKLLLEKILENERAKGKIN